MTPPKLFISYSWSDPEHEQWVLQLATELQESGIDVILDKWDLKEGHDSVAFMEKMVTDSNIKKVAIICDETYALKADGRAGGVGTETQIISKEVYDNQSQEKFVAIVRQKDDHGKPYLPTYYKSRIYIDLSEIDKYAENFERLLRWVYDKPLFIKPEIGKRPSFLEDGEHISIGTSASFKRCLDAIKNQKTYAIGSLDEYFSTFSENLEKFRINSPYDYFDEALIKNIDEFLPFRNEAIQLFITIAQYSQEEVFITKIHQFFENILPYMSRPKNISSWNDIDFDNYKFIVHELFLYALATFLKYDRLEEANLLLEKDYYLHENAEYGNNVIKGFGIFRQHIKSLVIRNDRLALRRLSVRADLLKDRCSGTGIEFRHLMQADFVAFIRAQVSGERWWPETLLYAERFNSAFEIFARSISTSYFKRVKPLLGIQDKNELEKIISDFTSGTKKLPSWEYESFDPALLTGYDYLASKA